MTTHQAPADVSGGNPEQTHVQFDDNGQPVTPTDTVAPTNKPEGVPEKFWDAEKGEVKTDDLIKSYTELEGKLGGNKPAEETVEGEEGKKPELKIEDQQKAADQAIEEAGLDIGALASEYSENGNDLKPETYAKLAETDYVKDMAKAMGTEPNELIKSYLAGQQALADNYSTSLMGEVGGADRYGEMVQWAAQNLSPAEIAAFDAAVDSQDIGQAKLAIAGLHAKWSQTATINPSNKASGGTASQTKGFSSITEMKQAQRDPRYGKTDAEGRAYMAEFEARMAATTL